MAKTYEIIDAENQVAKISETVQEDKERLLSVEHINNRISEIDMIISDLNAEKTELQTDLTEIETLL